MTCARRFHGRRWKRKRRKRKSRCRSSQYKLSCSIFTRRRRQKLCSQRWLRRGVHDDNDRSFTHRHDVKSFVAATLTETLLTATTKANLFARRRRYNLFALRRQSMWMVLTTCTTMAIEASISSIFLRVSIVQWIFSLCPFFFFVKDLWLVLITGFKLV